MKRSEVNRALRELEAMVGVQLIVVLLGAPYDYPLIERADGVVCSYEYTALSVEALLDALENGQIYGAGLDAFSEEPPKDERWFKLDNVVLGSHCAASTAGAASNMGTMATENIIRDLGL